MSSARPTVPAEAANAVLLTRSRSTPSIPRSSASTLLPLAPRPLRRRLLLRHPGLHPHHPLQLRPRVPQVPLPPLLLRLALPVHHLPPRPLPEPPALRLPPRRHPGPPVPRRLLVTKVRAPPTPPFPPPPRHPRLPAPPRLHLPPGATPPMPASKRWPSSRPR